MLLFTVKTISYLKLNLPWTSLYICWPTSSATLRTGVVYFLQVFACTSLSYLRPCNTAIGISLPFGLNIRQMHFQCSYIRLLLEKTLFRHDASSSLNRPTVSTAKPSHILSETFMCEVLCEVPCICQHIQLKLYMTTWNAIVFSIDSIFSMHFFWKLHNVQSELINCILCVILNIYISTQTQSDQSFNFIAFQIYFDVMPHISSIHLKWTIIDK